MTVVGVVGNAALLRLKDRCHAKGLRLMVRQRMHSETERVCACVCVCV